MVTHLPTLPAGAPLAEVFRRFPATSLPIVEYHEVVMRAPGPFDLGQRELIAAYVSGINACDYCHGVHAQVAKRYGIEVCVLEAALRDLDTAPVEDRMRPVLRFVGKLTRTPALVTQADANEVYSAGWDETALHVATMVCALFNFMNRMVEGHGITAGPQYYAESGTRLHDIGYGGLARLVAADSPTNPDARTA